MYHKSCLPRDLKLNEGSSRHLTRDLAAQLALITPNKLIGRKRRLSAITPNKLTDKKKIDKLRDLAAQLALSLSLITPNKLMTTGIYS